MNWIFTSCEVINPSENIPAYIHIDSIRLEITDIKQGTASSRITDAWVYVGGEFTGVYELPATFPVLANGEQKILVEGGIWENGISSARKFYAFYYPHIEYRTLAPKETDTIIPIVKYNENLNFDFMEDFESVGLNFEKLSGDTSVRKVIDSNVFEGSACGGVFLNDSITSTIFVSSEKFSVQPGTNVFAEMNYKCSNSFYVGIYDVSKGQKYFQAGVNPKSDWNKIYVNLTNLAGSIDSREFQLMFSVDKEDGVTFPVVYLDNIKMIH